LFMFPVNNCSPIPALMAMYENYGTITDRDYVISVAGRGTNKTYSVVPMDKVKFRNEKDKPYVEKAILKMLDKAFPCDESEDEDDEDEAPKKRPEKTASKGKKKPEPEPDEDDYEDEDLGDEAEDDDVVDYSEMSAQELYKLCKDRGIEVKSKKPARFYVKQLEEYDAAQDDWGEEDEEDDDDWEE